MKFKFLNRIIASALLISSLTQVSGAAQQCAVHFSGASAETTGERDLQSQIKKLQKVSFTALEKTQLAELIAQTGVTRFADHADLIKKLTAKIESEDLPPMEKSDKLAQVGLQIQDILEKRIETFFQKNGLTFAVESKFKLTSAEITAALKLANPAISEVELKLKSEKIEKEYAAIRLDLVKSRYGLSEKIAQLEAFKISEYEFVDSHALNNSGYTLISLTDYPDFAMSLAKKISPPRNYGSGGVVSLPEYRDVVSNNLWLFTLSGHDLKHIHFANSHPFAMGSIFRATRSKNYLRYFLMAASYEGVDTVQYGFETALARHFSAKGHTLEEALLFLTSATQEQLNEIARIIGVSSETGHLSTLKNWKPRTLKPELMPAQYKKTDQLENDILSAMLKSFKDLSDPSINYFMRPELLPNGTPAPEGTAQMPGNAIHHY